MRGLVRFVAFCFVGTLLGLVTAQQAISGRYGIISETKGPWTAWPRATDARIDPYTRAHHVSYGLVPSNRFDTVEFEAQIDDAGRTLDASCSYQITGPMPPARWWSLSALSSANQAGAVDEPRQGLVSRQLVFEPDQSFRINVSRELQAGNWLRPPETGRIVLLIRLYTPDTAVLRNPLTAELPSIERLVCR